MLRCNLTFERSVGRPHTLSVNASRLAAGSSEHVVAAASRLNNTAGYGKDDWSFVGAPIDQGIFWYLFYVRRDYGTWTRGGALDHFWGPYKPWRPAGDRRASSQSRYLWRLEDRDSRSGAPNCSRELSEYKARLVINRAWSDATYPQAGTTRIDHRPWLPGLSIGRQQRL